MAATGAKFNLPGSIRGLRDEQDNALYPTCEDIFGKEAELGKRVVIVGGSSPRIAEAMAYANSANEFYAIGDCNGAGNLWKSNRDAWSKANLI